MSHYLCMSCWRVSKAEALRTHCPECSKSPQQRPAVEDWMIDPNPSRPSRAGRRSAWKEVWLGEESGHAVLCERHQGSEMQLFCECGARILPRAQLASERPLGLGFAGPRSSGKTVMTLAMVHELRRRPVAGHDVGLSGLGDTEKRFGSLLNGFLRGEKPDATREELLDDDAQARPATSHFCWELLLGDGGRRAPMLLGIYDLAGETWAQSIDQSLPRFERYLRLLAALVFVVDGAAVAADLGLPARDAWDPAERSPAGASAADHQMLASLVDRMDGRAGEVSLAIVISKADLLWHEPKWSGARQVDGDGAAAEAGQELLEGILIDSDRRDLLTVGRHKFRNVRLFALSSLGFRPELTDVEDDRLTRRVEPAGLLPPLEWLLRSSWPAFRSA